MFIGTDGFADGLGARAAPAAPAPDNLRSFRSLAPTRDRKATARPTAPEVYDLLVYGDFDAGGWRAHSLGKITRLLGQTLCALPPTRSRARRR